MKNYGVESLGDGEGERIEQSLVRNLFCVVLAHHIHSVKGGWQQLEDTVNFLLMHSEQVCITTDNFADSFCIFFVTLFYLL